MNRTVFALGAVALLAACNSSYEATERARSDALAQTLCARRGILPEDSRYAGCRSALLADRTLVETSGAMTSAGNAPLAGDITPNPYSSRPSRGVYGSGI